MAVQSVMTDLGSSAPDFSLTEVESGEKVALGDLGDAPALVVAFICRHCPYVKHVQHEFASLASEYQQRGVAFVAISSNDPAQYPDDAPESLAEQKREVGFDFPYLFDETQDVAKAYKAACTPDFFVYDADRTLAYRGRMDETRPDQGTPTGADLRAALDALLAGERPGRDQWPSMGCSIKFRG
ncbi:MAG: thioredoxin family protein [Actinobacteria bacterium]|nr:thioredoxin family protein [Actinomycetota bacterium]